MTNGKRMILLDRDGTLITEQDYLKDPRKVRFLSGSIAGLRRLSRAGFPMVIVSNQSGVGRGLMTQGDVRQVMQRFKNILRAKGIRLAGVYWCPHHPSIRCACRKPGLGLIRKASRDLGIPWRKSISVGDKWCDVEMGQRTGGQGVLVRTGYGRKSLAERTRRDKADHIARNFNEASRWVLNAVKKEGVRHGKKST